VSDVDAKLESGWKVHAGIVLLGVALAVPVAILDLTFLGPSHGGWISLDFRGWLIGLYGAVWFVETLLSTLIVAVLRGRSGLVAISAHGAAIALMGLAGVATVAVVRNAEHEHNLELAREHDEAWALARTSLSVVSWHHVPEAEPPAIEVTFRASSPGRLGAEYVRSSEAYASPYAQHDIEAEEELTLTLPVDLEEEQDDNRYDADVGVAGDYIRVEWAIEGYNVPLRFCRPACLPESWDPDRILLELGEPGP